MEGEGPSFGVRRGMDVIDSDGEKLGEVKDALGDSLVSHKGWLFPTDHDIPASVIRSVDAQGVHLAVTKDDILAGERDPDDELGTPINEGVYDPRLASSSSEPIAAAASFDATLTEDAIAQDVVSGADILEEVSSPPVLTLPSYERRAAAATVHLID